MAGRYGASDLGSDWITVPRKFRGRKPTSSDTELAYITGSEKGLLGRLAKSNQVGPENIPSYDDSGFTSAYKPVERQFRKAVAAKNPSKLSEMQAQERINPRQSRAQRRQNIGATPARTTAQVNDLAAAVAKSEKRQGDIGSAKKRLAESGSTGQLWDKGVQDDSNRWKHVPEGAGDGGTTTTRDTPVIPPKDEDEDRGDDKGDEKVDGKICPHGTDAQGNCLPEKTVVGEDVDADVDADGTPSLETINQQVETPMLQELTSDMDLRNMLGSILNKNNPLFKQARTRALQAMAARGVVNSSLAEEAVMNAIMNVAMPIATRVIDDLQRVMAANVNASNAFKEALNAAYYKELQSRLDAANTWNLNRMLESGMNWRKMLEAKTGAAGIKTEDQYKRYMGMLGGQPGFNLGTPTYDVSGT